MSVEGFGPFYSLVVAYLNIIVLTFFPVVIVTIYIVRGPSENNNVLLEGLHIEKIGLKLCTFFWLYDYLSQGIMVSVLIGFTSWNLM
jgi:hypothetical protein